MAYDINDLFVGNEETSKRISEGIEKNRKGNFSIKVLPGDSVTVKLKKHKFRFGCNMFMLDEIPDDEQKNEIYKEKLKEFFNIATVPFYWDATEPEEGKTRYEKDSEKIYRRPPTDLCVEFCEKNGIEPREHALCYEHFFPKWLSDRSVDDIKLHLEERMKQISSRYAHRIPTIEVTNEMFWKSGITKFYKEPDYIDYCYRLADKYFPNNTLAINEWSGIWAAGGNSADTYYSCIEKELNEGGRIDAVGMQFHMFFRQDSYFNSTRTYYNAEHLFKILDNYSRFNKDIQITEVTIPAFTEDASDEESQADVIEKLYSLWFSHPNITQIIYWNLADGYAAFTTPGNMADGENYYRGGLLRFDMSEKPAFKRLRHLIKEVWTTNETITADENGTAKFRGFYGEYEITVNGKTYNYSFDENGKKAII
ncbi:MAG: endo-1,4-beta-xylanase [Eubacteriales bacterium]|nr:endo-1,4-beta-xylanase [Eubacteriales bacterium]